MRVHRLDHVNIRTRHLEATKDFYVEAIGLRLGGRPPFTFAGYWLYDDNIAVIHLAEEDASVATGTGPIDHVSFRVSGLAAARERLAELGIPFTERVVPRNGDVQLFLTDPNGVSIELTFDADDSTAEA